MNGILENPTVQWVVIIFGILVLFSIFRAFRMRKQLMGQAAKGDLRNIGAEGAREKKILDKIKRSKKKQQQEAAARQLEGETQRKLAEERRLEGDLRRGA